MSSSWAVDNSDTCNGDNREWQMDTDPESEQAKERKRTRARVVQAVKAPLVTVAAAAVERRVK